MATTEVKVQVTADGSQVPREADKIKKSIAGIGKEGEALSRSFAKVGGVIAGALSVGAITSFLSRVNQAADQLNDLSTRLGASASGLQSLQVAAQQAGGSAEAMATGLSKLQVTIGEGLQGSKKATEAFAQLGLSAQELSGLKTDEAMRRVAVALSEVENANARAQIGTDLLGKGFKENAGFFADAAGNLEAVNKALNDAGAAIDDLDVAKIGVMNDDLALQSTIVQNLGVKFLSGLTPAVGVATGSFAGLLTYMGGATEAGNSFGVILTGAIKLVEAYTYSLIAAVQGLKFAFASTLAVVVRGTERIPGLLGNAINLLGTTFRAFAGKEAASGVAESLDEIAKSALQSGAAAGEAAKLAALGVVNAQAIFAAASSDMLAKAEEAAARARALQSEIAPGAEAGKAGPLGASAKGGPLLSKDLLKDTGRAIADFDPLSDPQVLRQIEINSALLAIDDEYRGTMLGKLDTFNQSWLGSVLANNELQMQAEQWKVQSIGQSLGQLAGMAMQQGGKIGKAGKALAIAQTVWATASAAMQSFQNAGGYPWGIAPAAAVVAAGMAQLANIKKTNVGGGGGIAGARGGGGSVSAPSLSDNVSGAQPQQQEKTVTQVVIQGNVFSSQETAQWIIGQIRDAVESRDVVFISSNSRQGMELAGGT